MNADSDRHPAAAAAVKLLRVIGKQIRALRGNRTSFYPECTDLSVDTWPAARFPGVAWGPAASELVLEELMADKPSMICRLGATELATLTSATTDLRFGTALQLASGSDMVRDIGIHDGLVRSLCLLSGFFPASVEQCRRFVDLMLDDIREIDILGVWCKQEQRFADPLAGASKVRFRDLEPYMHEQPWSRALAGRRVLVVHPFAETIESQYRQRRTVLFANPLVLPEFELHTIKAVQSIANNETLFSTWFDALDHMKVQIAANKFDVAIIGCGAYGLPLAAYVKRLGRKAVHLGGQTQLLFGIKGKRWEAGHEQISRMFNEHWVYPDASDKPKRFAAVEGGAYW